MTRTASEAKPSLMPDRLENAFSDRETLLWLLTGLRVRSQDDLSR